VINAVGYSLLIQQLELTAVPLRRAAMVQPVTRLKLIGSALAVPPGMMPTRDDLLGHVLFALKHEGINLAVLAQALPKVTAETLERAYQEAPNGIYIRKACYLWEAFTGGNSHSQPRYESPTRRCSTQRVTSLVRANATRSGALNSTVWVI